MKILFAQMLNDMPTYFMCIFIVVMGLLVACTFIKYVLLHSESEIINTAIKYLSILAVFTLIYLLIIIVALRL